jgi:hypothetical protein
MQSMWSRTRLDRCPGPFELQAVTAKDKTKFLTNLLNRLPVRSAPVRTGVKPSELLSSTNTADRI